MARTRIQTLRSSTKGVRPAAADTPLEGELYVNYADKQLGVVNVGAATNQDLLAVRFFSTLADYAIGDYTIQAGQLYRAKAAVTAGAAFDVTKWDAVTPGGSGGAPLDSPVFTGDPRAPTPATSDNDTSISTTAFVKAAVAAAIAAIPAAPVREQYFDIGGLASKDIAVPSWARAVEITGAALVTPNTVYPVLRVSLDGTTFLAGASDYANVGPNHNSGTALYATAALGNADHMQLGLPSDSTTLQMLFQATLLLTRQTTGGLFHLKNYLSLYTSAAANLYRTYWGTAQCQNVGSGLAIRALRITTNTAGTFSAGAWVQVRWLGDPSAAPVYGAAQYFYPGAASPGGSATQNNNGITVGMRFTPLVAGKITGIRWYNGAVEAGTSGKVAVYSDAGVKLIEQSFSGLSTAIGWRQVALDYVVAAGTTYRCAVWLTLGSDSHAWYMAQSNKFNGAAITVTGIMTMPMGPNQNVFDEPDNSDIVFPNTSFNSTGYGVDVEFRPQV